MVSVPLRSLLASWANAALNVNAVAPINATVVIFMADSLHCACATSRAGRDGSRGNRRSPPSGHPIAGLAIAQERRDAAGRRHCDALGRIFRDLVAQRP